MGLFDTWSFCAVCCGEVLRNLVLNCFLFYRSRSAFAMESVNMEAILIQSI